MKKALIIIAFQNYQDQEYEPTKQALENAGVQITTISSQIGTAQGVYGGNIQINLTLDQVDVADYDVIAFIGGGGAVEYQNNPTAHQIAQDAVAQNKILAAICIAPTILAQAGVLQNKSATVWTSITDKNASNILKQNGANYVGEDVVVDEKIITANGPPAAPAFGQKIVELLNQ
jgi:protease I